MLSLMCVVVGIVAVDCDRCCCCYLCLLLVLVVAVLLLMLLFVFVVVVCARYCCRGLRLLLMLAVVVLMLLFVFVVIAGFVILRVRCCCFSFAVEISGGDCVDVVGCVCCGWVCCCLCSLLFLFVFVAVVCVLFMSVVNNMVALRLLFFWLLLDLRCSLRLFVYVDVVGGGGVDVVVCV